MPVVKLVVIGASGVGKTSLRGKYIEGHFSTGYRATIGADFITKNLPHPTNPNDSVTLQIWDTAGQERFSSLSTAFFRGADAAILMFDVNAPETMHALKKWWADFVARAPLADEDMHDYCVVVVGNKIDMAGKGGGAVSQSEALEFLDDLVPPLPAVDVLPPSASDGSPQLPDRIPLSGSSSADHIPSPSIAIPPSGPLSQHDYAHAHGGPARPSRAASASPSPKHQLFKSRSSSSSRFYAGTMTTTHTTLTVYHTPSSSLFDAYQSARASPEPPSSGSAPGSLSLSSSAPVPVSAALSSPVVPSSSPAAPLGTRARTLTMLSTGSTSSGSAPTITPSLVARERAAHALPGASPTTFATPSPVDTRAHAYQPAQPPLPPERGPRLFFTSAKTGEGVADVFEYVAQRVVQKWDYDEWVDARMMHFREASGAGNVRLDGGLSAVRGWGKGKGKCC